MLSYGGVDLKLPSGEEMAWIEASIPMPEAFGFLRFGEPAAALDPFPFMFNWFLGRPFRLNCLFHPWGASRFGYSFVLVDGDMREEIDAKNSAGNALPFVMDDGVGGAITTDLFALPAVPLAKILNASPQLPLHLLPLVDLRYFWWERSAEVIVTEGTTTWESLYSDIAAGLGITLAADPISADYLFPSYGLTQIRQPLPLLLDLAALSVGQRIVRTLDGNFFARSATTGQSLMIAQANANRKFAGGSLDLGVVDA